MKVIVEDTNEEFDIYLSSKYQSRIGETLQMYSDQMKTLMGNFKIIDIVRMVDDRGSGYFERGQYIVVRRVI